MQCPPQPIGFDHISANITFLQRQNFRCCHSFFNNFLHRPIARPHHSPKPMRIGLDNSEHGDRSGIGLLQCQHLLQGLAGDERHIRAGDDHPIGCALQQGFCAQHGVAGAKLLVLHHKTHPADLFLHLFRAVPNHNHRLLAANRSGILNGIGNQRSPG